MKTTKKNIGLKACVAFVVLVISISCEKGNATEATDYSISAHWLTVPAITNKAVDVFYLYPTAWSNNDPFPVICEIDNPSMLIKAPESSALQVTAFEPIGNIYAPFYRQDNLSPSNRLEMIAGTPTLDAVAAFDYYIKNFNHGRPFILAGHSQGSDVLSNLLAGYMKDNPAVLARMIAAYVIGFPITAEYLANNPHLKFAEGPGDTGVIISYNTEAPDVAPGTNPVLSGLIGVVINPITWTRDETLATTNEGFGSFMPNASEVFTRVPQYADAQIDKTKGVLICRSADEDAIALTQPELPRGVYHNFDYPFYYFNIRSNAANRTQNFLNKVGSDYDADGKADPAVYDPASGAFTVLLSGSSYASFSVIMSVQPSAFGLQPIPGDFDGDSKADPAVYDPIANQFLVRYSSQSYSLSKMPIGNSSCVPVCGDFDGDHKADPALYSATSGLLTVWLSGSGYSAASTPLGGVGWSNASGDYDGDGVIDPAVYEAGDPSTGSGQGGTWQVLLSSDGYSPFGWVTAGGAGVVPVPGDYDGDGKADLMVYQPAGGQWLCTFSGQGYTTTEGMTGFGDPTRVARAGDYDGDGKTDPAVFDPVTRTFYVMLSGSGYRVDSLSW